jgi:hypothetical protein
MRRVRSAMIASSAGPRALSYRSPSPMGAQPSECVGFGRALQAEIPSAVTPFGLISREFWPALSIDLRLSIKVSPPQDVEGGNAAGRVEVGLLRSGSFQTAPAGGSRC